MITTDKRPLTLHLLLPFSLPYLMIWHFICINTATAHMMIDQISTESTRKEHCRSLSFLSAYSDPRMATGSVNLKLLVDKSNRRVLFAEGGKDFVDFLFHILTLPVGTVIRLLEKTGMVGSLGNLYNSIEKLNDVYIKSSKKNLLLKPKAPASLAEIKFKLPETSLFDSTPKTYYRCSTRSSDRCSNYVAEECYATCPQCGNSMHRQFTFVKSPAGDQSASVASTAESDDKGGFVQGVVTYMVMDDLEVMPMSTISSITLLNKFNVKEIGHLEERVVSLGMDEGIKLLKSSLHSKKVLTEVFLGEK
ncbi:hypothetical protein NL676_003950 [Syzygium grande]|nr:hypothetical protein NL676_003950 [Syzygium grande]